MNDTVWTTTVRMAGDSTVMIYRTRQGAMDDLEHTVRTWRAQGHHVCVDEIGDACVAATVPGQSILMQSRVVHP